MASVADDAGVDEVSKGYQWPGADEYEELGDRADRPPLPLPRECRAPRPRRRPRPAPRAARTGLPRRKRATRAAPQACPGGSA